MTSNRNVFADQKATNEAIEVVTSGRFEGVDSCPNWLGHKGRNRTIDACLIKGEALAEMVTHSGRNTSAVRSHLHHLRTKHGLQISRNGEFYQFLRQDLPGEFGSDEEYPGAGFDELVVDLAPTAKPDVVIGWEPANKPKLPHGDNDSSDQDLISTFAYGLVVLNNDGVATARIFSDRDTCLSIVNSPETDLLFLLTGTDESGVLNAVNAVADVWNIWCSGFDSTYQSNQLSIRKRKDWKTVFADGLFYVYEYKFNGDGITFYVGKGTGKRDISHIDEVMKKVRSGVDLSAKHRNILRELESSNNLPVRRIATFIGPYAELSAFAVERLLIFSVYGVYSLNNETSGNTDFRKYYWLSRPKSVNLNQINREVWRSVATAAVQDQRSFPTGSAQLVWMEAENYLDNLRRLFVPLEQNQIVTRLGAGQRGQDITAEWQMVKYPVRLQLKFSCKAPRVRFNLRPKSSTFGAVPSINAAREFRDWVQNGFARYYPVGTQIIKKPNDNDCFFKPFATDADGRMDVSLDVTDSNERSIVDINWNRDTSDLSLIDALHLLMTRVVGTD